jgi:hypothetical protein
MGAIDPQTGDMRKLNWDNPNEAIRDNERGLTEAEYERLSKVPIEHRAKTYAHMRQEGKRPRSCFPKSARK